MSDKQQALDAIRGQNFIEAQKIAVDLIKSQPEDAESWYLLSLAVPGERAHTFRQKAMLIDPEVASTFESPEVGTAALADPPGFEEMSPLVEKMNQAVAAGPTEDVVTEHFAVPNAKPRVPKKATAGSSKPVQREASRGIDTNTLLLFVIGLLIIIVLGLLIRSLF